MYLGIFYLFLQKFSKMCKVELLRRYIVFTAALFVSALGVSVITRSYLGTSPISSVPFVLSINTILSMGMYIFILNMILVCIQMLMLGRKGIHEHRIDLLMQIPVSVAFGLFIDMTMWFLRDYAPELYVVKIISLIVGCAILAFGICLEVVADVTMVSGEYTVQIASRRFNKEFGKVKIFFDVALVVLAVLFSWLLASRIDGIREGTIIAALVTGPFVGVILPRLNIIRKWQLSKSVVPDVKDMVEDVSPIIITISREYGSGGHLIGKKIADSLSIPFYDNELITMAAKESNMSESFVSENEQQLPKNLLLQMVRQDYEAPLEKSLSPDDALFVAQSRVIRRIASAGNCVIIGRCADYILNDFPNVINIFLYANMKYKIDMAVKEYGINRAMAAQEIDRIDRARKEHYFHYTGQKWGGSHNYHLCCDTAVLSQETICSIIENIYKDKKA